MWIWIKMEKLDFIMGDKEKQLIKEGKHPHFFWHSKPIVWKLKK